MLFLRILWRSCPSSHRDPAPAANRIKRPQVAPDDAGHNLEQFIARVVAVSIVDLLEVLLFLHFAIAVFVEFQHQRELSGFLAAQDNEFRLVAGRPNSACYYHGLYCYQI